MIHVTRRLTAKNRDRLRNPTLGNRVWATFTFFTGSWTYFLFYILFILGCVRTPLVQAWLRAATRTNNTENRAVSELHVYTWAEHVTGVMLTLPT